MVSHRAYLVRFAQRKLRDPMLAEDVVHDVFEAVLSGRAAFAGRARAALVADGDPEAQDRRPGAPRTPASTGWTEDVDDAGALTLECPQPRPDEVAEQRERLRTDARSASTRCRRACATSMRLRVLDDQPTATVCQALGISEENLFVRLHRARKQLAC